MPDTVPMPWRQPLDELRAAHARACGTQASAPSADQRLSQAVCCEQAGIRLELAQRGVWIGDVVRLEGAARPVRGVLELRDGPPYLIVRTGPQDGDFVPVPPGGALQAEQAWGPPDSLTGDPVALIASNLALSEATARITERLIRSAGHPVEVFYGDSRLVVLQLAARFLARPEYAWRNGLVDQHAVRAVSVQMSREGCQFELPGSAQEWFATELIEAYLQQFRPGMAARAALEQTAGLDAAAVAAQRELALGEVFAGPGRECCIEIMARYLSETDPADTARPVDASRLARIAAQVRRDLALDEPADAGHARLCAELLARLATQRGRNG